MLEFSYNPRLKCLKIIEELEVFGIIEYKEEKIDGCVILVKKDCVKENQKYQGPQIVVKTANKDYCCKSFILTILRRFDINEKDFFTSL